ncbi:serine hydrolase [Deinococcus lacus]|uniref:Serine hydrolase n=1 Tax=Deinococcus lacus TaxID=392561 RepID=A0ABW1YA08_9DEIO
MADLDPQTLEVRRAVATNPDSLFPLASTYKQAVLWAVLREFGAGRLSPTERFDVTPGQQSLGEYPYDGTNVKALTIRMIQRSDNTATDILHRRVGLGRVQALADDLRLCHTRLILPTKDWWAAQAGLSPTYQQGLDWDTASQSQRLAWAAGVDQDTRRLTVHELAAHLNPYFEQLHQPADDLAAHNVSTPYEFSTLLAHQYLRGGLTARAQKWQQEVAQLGYGKSALRAGQVGNIRSFYGKGATAGGC